MDEQPQETAAARAEAHRLVIWLHAIGTFLKGAATTVTKVIVSAAVLSVYTNMHDSMPWYFPATVIVGIFALDLFRFIRVKTPWFEIDLREDKPTKEEDNGKDPQS